MPNITTRSRGMFKGVIICRGPFRGDPIQPHVNICQRANLPTIDVLQGCSIFGNARS